MDLAELKRSAMMYSLYCKQNSLRQIADEVGMSKQSVGSRLKTLDGRSIKSLLFRPILPRVWIT